jgi:hypothetical protein
MKQWKKRSINKPCRLKFKEMFAGVLWMRSKLSRVIVSSKWNHKRIIMYKEHSNNIASNTKSPYSKINLTIYQEPNLIT